MFQDNRMGSKAQDSLLLLLLQTAQIRRIGCGKRAKLKAAQATRGANMKVAALAESNCLAHLSGRVGGGGNGRHLQRLTLLLLLLSLATLLQLLLVISATTTTVIPSQIGPISARTLEAMAPPPTTTTTTTTDGRPAGRNWNGANSWQFCCRCFCSRSVQFGSAPFGWGVVLNRRATSATCFLGSESDTRTQSCHFWRQEVASEPSWPSWLAAICSL